MHITTCMYHLLPIIHCVAIIIYHYKLSCAVDGYLQPRNVVKPKSYLEILKRICTCAIQPRKMVWYNTVNPPRSPRASNGWKAERHFIA